MIIKIKCDGYFYPVDVTPEDTRLVLKFKYNPKLIEEVKNMSGARWNPDGKFWTISNNQRNLFQLQYLGGGNPYAKYDEPLKPFVPRRSWLMEHQIEMASFASTRQYCIFACEMGTGKTLTMIEVMEQSGTRDWWWIGPRNAIYSVKNEFKRWTICDSCHLPARRVAYGDTVIAENCKCPIFISTHCFEPKFFSYEELVKLIKSWSKDKVPPKRVVFDESSRCKNPASQRSQASQALANAVREQWKDDGSVVEMSGSPAPKDPTDWYSQCEIARPGYLREGDIHKFKRRLCIIEQRENSITGGTYPQLITWLDSEKKCNVCGSVENHPAHNLAAGGHSFIKSKDEVSFLYKRMHGLVLVKLKKDCMNLPDKQYEVIELGPTTEMKRCASLIEAKCTSTIQTLTLLRELSDGFQYRDEDIGATQTCPRCHGLKTTEEHYYCGPEDQEDSYREDMKLGKQIPPGIFEKQKIDCPYCDGTGEVVKLNRVTKEVNTPKEDALKAQLELHEDVGRIVIFAGFTGSIDRVTNICKKEGWDVIRLDGRGWDSTIPGNPETLLQKFQEGDGQIAFVLHPASGGLGLNLTASPTIVYWSNDFNAESRIQSEDRIHRPGMDVNRGAKIIDLVCLKSDLLVINNLKRKRRLQDLTLGQMREEIAAIRFSDLRSY